jgi:hypothetical protein
MKGSLELLDSFFNNVVKRNFPEAKIKYKDKSPLMKFLGSVLFFNPAFMSRFTTVLGTTVYFPNPKWLANDYGGAIRILAHEFVHMWDRRERKKGLDWFSILYLSPQIWALGALLALLGFVNLGFLWALVCLVFLIPWPSPWRTHYELNGYAMTMFFSSILAGSAYNVDKDAEYYSYYFTTSKYYFMCWSKKYVISELKKRYETLPNTHGAFKEFQKWVKIHLR